MCHLAACRVFGCLSVGGSDGFVKVGGNDACVNVISQGSVVGIVLGRIMGEGDETCVCEGEMNVGGRGVLGESFGMCVV